MAMSESCGSRICFSVHWECQKGFPVSINHAVKLKSMSGPQTQGFNRLATQWETYMSNDLESKHQLSRKFIMNYKWWQRGRQYTIMHSCTDVDFYELLYTNSENFCFIPAVWKFACIMIFVQLLYCRVNTSGNFSTMQEFLLRQFLTFFYILFMKNDSIFNRK